MVTVIIDGVVYEVPFYDEVSSLMSRRNYDDKLWQLHLYAFHARNEVVINSSK